LYSSNNNKDKNIRERDNTITRKGLDKERITKLKEVIKKLGKDKEKLSEEKEGDISKARVEAYKETIT
jgi:acyl-[acyl carrier protein]--UDP-N-acetylglucosamine O-acyltransferase